MAHINLVVAVFIWVMIYPMMIQIDGSAVKDVGKKPRGLVLTLVINWLIKPFTMAALGVLFFQSIFAPFVNPQSASEYIAGMILLGVAPCTAMVFVFSHLVKGDANYTLVQVSVNDLPQLDARLFHAPDPAQLRPTHPSTHAPRFLLLYGSLRERSFSRLLTEEARRMKPSSYFDRVVDVMEELVKLTLPTRDAGPYLVDRYSERKESADALSKRVNQRSI